MVPAAGLMSRLLVWMRLLCPNAVTKTSFVKKKIAILDMSAIIT
jgi:hypothetical protein